MIGRADVPEADLRTISHASGLRRVVKAAEPSADS
jgi:hypothetical protein